MLGGRYRWLRLSFHTSNTSGELTSALSEMTGGKLFRASVLLVSSGANCLHLLQFARVALSLMMEAARSSANVGASAVYIVSACMIGMLAFLGYVRSIVLRMADLVVTNPQFRHVLVVMMSTPIT